MFRELEAKAASELAEEGLDPSAAVFERDLDMRYAGQGYELRVSLGGLWQHKLDGNALLAVRLRFHEVHEKIHGHAAKEKSVDVVSYRLRVRVAVPKYSPQPLPAGKPSSPPLAAVKGTRRVLFDANKAVEDHGLRSRPACRRHGLQRAPPSSSSSMRRPSCRPVGMPRSTAMAI